MVRDVGLKAPQALSTTRGRDRAAFADHALDARRSALDRDRRA
jgi:hypothetical protein